MAVYDWLVDYLDRVSKGGRYLGGCSLVIQYGYTSIPHFGFPPNQVLVHVCLNGTGKQTNQRHRLVEQKKIKKSEVLVTLKVSLLEKSQYLKDEDVEETMEADKEHLESEGIVLGVESELKKESSEDDWKHIKILAKEREM
ncbi:uncharacterized protein LOC143889857 [Tasmannia lanceolata]|uniref:uncharacterized protein LOC143889857 n=1 Tax=Tasmannia lanceolata TaxID=3420 RepID=UPI0040645A05